MEVFLESIGSKMNQGDLKPSYTSMFAINGVRMYLPPLLNEKERGDMQNWKQKAVEVEKRLKERKSRYHSPKKEVYKSSPQLRPQSSPKPRDALVNKSGNFESRLKSSVTPSTKNPLDQSIDITSQEELVAPSDSDVRGQSVISMLSKVALSETASTSYSTSKLSSVQNVSQSMEFQNSSVVQSKVDNHELSPDDETLNSVDTLKGFGEEEEVSKTSPQNRLVVRQTNGSLVYHSSKSQSSEMMFQEATRQLQESVKAQVSTSHSPKKDQLKVVESEHNKQKAVGHLAQVVKQILTEQQNQRLISEQEILQDLLDDNQQLSITKLESSSQDSVFLKKSSLLTGTSAAATSNATISSTQQRSSMEVETPRIDAATLRKLGRLPALVRGHLTRRMLMSPKVQTLARTVRDARALYFSLISDRDAKKRAGVRLTTAEVALLDRVTAQLRAALADVHRIFLETSSRAVHERAEIFVNLRELDRNKVLATGSSNFTGFHPERELHPSNVHSSFSASVHPEETMDYEKQYHTSTPRLSSATLKARERRAAAARSEREALEHPYETLPKGIHHHHDGCDHSNLGSTYTKPTQASTAHKVAMPKKSKTPVTTRLTPKKAGSAGGRVSPYSGRITRSKATRANKNEL